MNTKVGKYLALSDYKIDVNLFAPISLVLTLIALISSMQAFYQLPSTDQSTVRLFQISAPKMIYWWYFVVMAYVVQMLSKRILFERGNVIRWPVIHAFTLTLSFMLHETISLWTEKIILGRDITTSLIFIVFNNPSVWIEILVYTLFLLMFYLIEYRRINRENEIKCSQLEARLIKSKLQELRSKIHPQFLFNTLRTISNLVQKQRNRDANYILSVLSDFLRTTVYDAEREEITLEEELRFLNQYLEIENIRSKDSITVSEDIDKGVLSAAVPNYILQPIVDDLVYRTKGDIEIPCNISIRIRRQGTDLEILIENTGIGEQEYSSEDVKDRALLSFIEERLSQLYGEAQDLVLSYDKEAGVMVKIRIPFQIKETESEVMYALEKSF
jgi:two-component system LytT family sensor kinase